MSAPTLITLTTDFGLADPYVAAMKGVILSVNTRATIVDVSHAVRPQRIEQGAFVLASAWPYFPPGTIHVAVVDPGVGSERRALALKTGDGVFIGPDNGILSAALPDAAREQAEPGGSPLALPPGTRAVVLSNQRFHRRPVSATFHGRDIFAPVAAHLSLGVPFEELGNSTDRIVALPPFRASPRPDGSLSGRIIHIDRFGNLVTDVRLDQLPPGRFSVEVGGRVVSGPAATYAEGSGLIALVGSAGYLEIALREGDACAELGAGIGQPVSVRPSP